MRRERSGARGGKERRRIRRRRILRPRLHLRPPSPRVAIWAAIGLAVGSALLVALAGRAAKAAVAIVLLSILLAYLVAPAALHLRRLAIRRRRRLSATAALLVVYAGVALVFAVVRLLIGRRLLDQIDQFTASVPAHVDRALRYTASLAEWQAWFGWRDVSPATIGSFPLALSDWVRQHVAEALVDALDYRWVVPWLGLVPILSFLWLTQFGTFRRSTLRVLPRGHVRWRGSELLEQVNSVLAGYARAQVLSSLVVGITCAVGLALLGVPYALLVGFAAGALEFVPVIGPIAAALLAAGLVRGGHLVAVLVFLAGIRLLQDVYVYPRLMGRRVHLPPLAVLLAVWLGATTGGILGVLLAVPVVAVGAVAARQWRDYREVERLVRAHARLVVPAPDETGDNDHSISTRQSTT